MSGTKADFLVEILTEELPPKALPVLARSLITQIKQRLQAATLEYKEAQFFATPRRLAVLVKGLAAQQPDTVAERRGPALAAAFDAAGNPSAACAGFARSLNVTPADLTRIETAQGTWVGYTQTVSGKSVHDILPSLVQQALAALPIPKPMRWGRGDVAFVRPVHSVIMLYGDVVIDAEILGVMSGNQTQGHRFHTKRPLTITKPAAYVKRLQAHHVIADFATRQAMIKEQAEAIVANASNATAHALIDPALLAEVTGLVEWPVALLGDFDPRFLEVPAEALICAMQDHQRYFPVVDNTGKLLPHFVTISNIEARDMQHVIAGNERVLRARLADAAFFFTTDQKQTLSDRLPALRQVVYHVKLGSLHERAERLASLARFIATALGVDAELAARAGLLAKTDLLTHMVGEFPELQGVAGKYYALADGEPQAVAEALYEQYLPRFSGDVLPETMLGNVLALADRVDTLVGAFGIQQIPTGDKDPFALKRAALGVCRILIEKKLPLAIAAIIDHAVELYGAKLTNPRTAAQLSEFFQERLKPWYLEQGISADVFAAVATLPQTQLYDLHRRILAVQQFKELPEAPALCVANKRVSNILSKYTETLAASAVNPALFEAPAEHTLAAELAALTLRLQPLLQAAQYAEVLATLATLRAPVDDFFDQVMVMADDLAVRHNRLLLLTQLRALFLQVADVAMLQMQAPPTVAATTAATTSCVNE